MGKRKFSFDIPRLKIGGTRADFRAIREHLSSDKTTALDDSPPPTPKSVRPPLSPHEDAALRAACSIVLAGGEPATGERRNNRDPAIATLNAKPQLDYAAIKRTAGAVTKGASSPPQPRRHREKETHVSQKHAERFESPPRLSPDAYRYKPDLNTEELFQQLQDDDQEYARQTAADARAEQLMGGKPMKPPPSMEAARDRSEAHKRSQSSPQALAPTRPKLEKGDAMVHRPKPNTRTESMETTSTASHTDGTDDPHSTSTGITSAYVTPARSSKRASSQGLEVKTSNLQKMDNISDDWVWQELEKHKQARKEREETDHENTETPGSENTTTPSSAIPTAVAAVPSRKPVSASVPSRTPSTVTPAARSNSRLENLDPPRSASIQDSETETKRSDSKQFIGDLLRSRSTKATASPRSDSQQARDSAKKRDWRDMHSLNGQEGGSKGMRRARSITRKIGEYARPGTTQGEEKSHSRTRSRSRSIGRQVKEYFRPSSGMSGRKESVDAARPSLQTMRSHDSQQSANSGAAQGLRRSTSQKFKAWKGATRANRSASSPQTSRPGSSEYKEPARGRQESRDRPTKSKSKPPIDLNRELPPLPGLDSWKDAQSTPTTPVVKVDSPGSKPSHSPASTAKKSSRPKVQRKQLSAQDREDILMARMGTPTHQRSNASSFDSTNKAFCSANNPWQDMPPQPSAPPPPPPINTNVSPATTVPRPESRDDAQLTPQPSYQSAFVAEEVKRHSRNRSKSLQFPAVSTLTIPQTLPPVPNQTSQPLTLTLPSPLSPLDPDFSIQKYQPSNTGRAQIINMSRFTTDAKIHDPDHADATSPPPLPQHQTTTYPPPTQAPTARTSYHSRKPSASVSGGSVYATPPAGHSRNPSTLTAADFSPPAARTGSPIEPLSLSDSRDAPTGEKLRINPKKWFPYRKQVREKTGGKEQQENWMDAVVKSGANSGAIVGEEGAGAVSPSVRY